MQRHTFIVHCAFIVYLLLQQVRVDSAKIKLYVLDKCKKKNIVFFSRPRPLPRLQREGEGAEPGEVHVPEVPVSHIFYSASFFSFL